MEQFAYVNNKKLRCGYTTGSCAAAAAKAAVQLLLTGSAVQQVALATPAGVLLTLEVRDTARGVGWAKCAIQKDSGDDPDVTNGVLVYAHAAYADEGITLDGGEGVGRVTKPGLDCPVGAAAINTTPRKMITDAVRESCEECGYHGGISVTISIPAGVALAAKTYNPRLGIVGGISVLGTSGIVKPMSEQALVDSIAVEMKLRKVGGARRIVLTPGNYGESYARDVLGIETADKVQCSNFVGDALDIAVRLGFEEVLLVGHLGKLVKLAGGIFNTHSHNADCRMELITAHAALSGARAPILERLMACITTDEAVAVLDETALRSAVVARLQQKIDTQIGLRTGGAVEVGTVVFSNRWGTLSMSANAQRLISLFTEDTR